MNILLVFNFIIKVVFWGVVMLLVVKLIIGKWLLFLICFKIL